MFIIRMSSYKEKQKEALNSKIPELNKLFKKSKIISKFLHKIKISLFTFFTYILIKSTVITHFKLLVF